MKFQVNALAVTAVVCVGLTALGAAITPEENKPLPKVTGPVTGGDHGWPLAASFRDLREMGYTESEYFIEGQASRFVPSFDAPLTMDGKWSVERKGAESPYKTRILVRRPNDPKRFNGTVVVEWMQSQGGYDKDVFWIWVHEEILRGGYAWVGVTADRQAITGLAAPGAITTPPGGSPDGSRGLARWDPKRYGSLNLENEDLGYDVFSQAARIIGPHRPATPVDPMGGLKVDRLLAAGATGSSIRLVTYYDAVQPLDKVYNGFLIHARIYPRAEQLSAGVTQPPIAHVRTDLQVPVIVTNNEGEALRHLTARQPDSAFYRLWETVGSQHTNDYWTPKFTVEGARDFGGKPSPLKTCGVIHDVPSHYVEDAALAALDRWARGGPAAPHFEPISFSGSPAAADPDSNGNAKGGIRLPQITAPLARHEGKMSGGCEATIFPLSPEKLRALYPSFDAYAVKYKQALAEAQKEGILLSPDAKKELETLNERRSVFVGK